MFKKKNYIKIEFPKNIWLNGFRLFFRDHVNPVDSLTKNEIPR